MLLLLFLLETEGQKLDNDDKKVMRRWPRGQKIVTGFAA